MPICSRGKHASPPQATRHLVAASKSPKLLGPALTRRSPDHSSTKRGSGAPSSTSCVNSQVDRRGGVSNRNAHALQGSDERQPQRVITGDELRLVRDRQAVVLERVSQ
eukprot:9495915-Pyramimonas_sp.AAC.2